MKISIWQLVAACFVVGIVSGCAVKSAEFAGNPAQRQAQLEALTSFSFAGGLGIWSDEQSLSARIRWQQDGDNLDIRLSGPLGIGNMTLAGNADGGTLSRASTVISEGKEIDVVVQQGLGLAAPVPITQLRRWVRGLAGDSKSVVRDAQGKISSLRYIDTQGTSWNARFLRYKEVDDAVLPSLITAIGGPYTVRLVLRDWQLADVAVVPDPKQSNTRLAIPTR